SAALRERGRSPAVDLLDEGSHIAHDLQNQGWLLQYQIETGAAQRLLYEFLSPELKKLPMRHRKFRANRSMRDVEPSVKLWVKTLDKLDVEDGESYPNPMPAPTARSATARSSRPSAPARC